jgi:hypothetical protein
MLRRVGEGGRSYNIFLLMTVRVKIIREKNVRLAVLNATPDIMTLVAGKEGLGHRPHLRCPLHRTVEKRYIC